MIHKSSQSSTQSGGQAISTAPELDAGGFDMSMDAVPNDWVQAQDESKVTYGEYATLAKSSRFDAIPTGGDQGSFVSTIAATGASLFAGGVWCLADLVGLYSGPWSAVGVAAVIALAVRFAGGTDSMFQAVLCLAYYFLTLAMVLMVLTYWELNEIYGSIGGLDVYESTLVRTRLQDPVHIVAFAIGGLLTSQLSYLGRPQH